MDSRGEGAPAAVGGLSREVVGRSGRKEIDAHKSCPSRESKGVSLTRSSKADDSWQRGRATAHFVTNGCKEGRKRLRRDWEHGPSAQSGLRLEDVWLQ